MKLFFPLTFALFSAYLLSLQPANALGAPIKTGCSPNCTVSKASVNSGNDGVNYQCLADAHGGSACGYWCWAHRLSPKPEEGSDAGGGNCTCKYASTVELFVKEGGTANFPHQGNAAEIDEAKNKCARQGGEAVMGTVINKKILGHFISSCKGYCEDIATSAAPATPGGKGAISPEDTICQSIPGKNYKKALDVADFKFMLDSKNIAVEVNYCCETDNPNKPPVTRTSTDPDYNFQIPIPGLRTKTGLSNDTTVKLCQDKGGAYECGGMTAYIAAIYRWGVGFASIIAMLVLIYGGLLWLTSRGNSTQTGDAKKVMINAIIGLSLALGSYVFLWTINPRLVNPSALVIKLPNNLDIWFKPPQTGTADLTSLQQTEYCSKLLKPPKEDEGGAPPDPGTSEPAPLILPRGSSVPVAQ
ncbi:hypothetical protein HY620_03620 [Candidatus Uhrbacteria bacterium]|nr:hypothetical protein [Candidatus Uhrbacteria bacterium]